VRQMGQSFIACGGNDHLREESPRRHVLIFHADHAGLRIRRKRAEEAFECVVLPLPVTAEREVSKDHFEEVSELVSLGDGRRIGGGGPAGLMAHLRIVPRRRERAVRQDRATSGMSVRLFLACYEGSVPLPPTQPWELLVDGRRHRGRGVLGPGRIGISDHLRDDGITVRSPARLQVDRIQPDGVTPGFGLVITAPKGIVTRK
jgi:hypothetical protein